MANRRMFSNRIANSARFLQMPLESQALYFHLVLRADDDGVVESYPIVRLLGVAPDSMKVLIAKEFVKVLNDDQVVLIHDWLEHNVIRADRKVNSIYQKLLPQNIVVVEPKPRSDVIDNSNRLGGPSTDGLSKVRLGKVSTPEAIASEVVPFSLEREIDKMVADKQKHIRALGVFLSEKHKRYGLRIVDKAQLQLLIKRHVRDAKAIADSIRSSRLYYEAIEKAFARCGDEATVGTVIKYLTK